MDQAMQKIARADEFHIKSYVRSIRMHPTLGAYLEKQQQCGTTS